MYFMLNVPHDAPNGHEVVFEGKGDESPDWEPGDVIEFKDGHDGSEEGKSKPN